MGTFMESLAANPNGSGGGIYGQVPQTHIEDPFGLMNSIKDREMRDFRDKANFMADLSVKQDRLRKRFDLEDNWTPSRQTGVPGQQNTAGMNTVMAKDPNQMTGYERGELGIKQQGLGIEKQRLAQQGRLGEEAIGIRQKQGEIAQQKNEQINATKISDMERKKNEADAKIEQAQAALESKNNNAEASLKAHKDLAAAMEERHKLELAQKNTQFKESQAMHQKSIDALNEKIKQQGRTKTTTELNPDGTKKTVTTERGDSADTVNVTGKDGKTYTIPKDKLDDWNKNHKLEEENNENQPDDESAE